MCHLSSYFSGAHFEIHPDNKKHFNFCCQTQLLLFALLKSVDNELNGLVEIGTDLNGLLDQMRFELHALKL
jgi:hypothetical protein